LTIESIATRASRLKPFVACRVAGPLF